MFLSFRKLLFLGFECVYMQTGLWTYQGKKEIQSEGLSVQFYFEAQFPSPGIHEFIYFGLCN